MNQDSVDQIVASVGTLQLLIPVQTLLVNVRRAMLLQPAASVLLVITELQTELVNVRTIGKYIYMYMYT